ncbi:MAG: 3-oxoacyl-[acyl-carrier-protein] synthase III C-terminal domain-containing protein [Pseudomonadota bacterium]
MPDLGIKSYSVYIPRLRMDRAAIAAAHAWAIPGLKSAGKGERAFCSWDEDSITMSVDAVRACLRASDPAPVRALTFASTTAPFADLQNASVISAAAALPMNITSLDVGGSLRSGTSALIRALESFPVGDSIVVAADNRRAKPASPQEMQYGAGSAAFRTGSGDVIARYLGSASSFSQFVDHFRSDGQKHDYHWEERWVRDEGYLKIVPDVLVRLLQATGVAASQIDHFCLPATIPGVSAGVAKKVGIRPQAIVDNLAARCGDTGAAHALMMLAAALETATPGQKILVVGFGAGCDALLLETTAAILTHQAAASVSGQIARGVTEKSYNKLLSFSGEIELNWGMRAEFDTKTSLTQLYRSSEQIISFVGGQCAACQAIQFPRMPACVRCGSTAPMASAPLADQAAKVATFTADWLVYYPAPPMYAGLVQFDNGARALMEVVDVVPEAFEVGTPLRMVFRIKDRDAMRHHHRYFWKATPLV